MKNTCCIICKKEFSYKGIFTHYDRSHLGKTQYSYGYNGKYKQISLKLKLKKQNKESAYLSNPKKCLTCSETIPYEKRKNKFCNASCAAKTSNVGKVKADNVKEKISKRLRKNPESYKNICSGCGNTFTHVRKKKYCSLECKRQEYLKSLNEKQRYRKECQFNFNLSDYLDKFDFNLIEKYGWYKASNRGNNPEGISRDHMVSIDYGWKNNISPDIISHPANCRLMKHTDNLDKRTDCSITIEELYERIHNWN